MKRDEYLRYAENFVACQRTAYNCAALEASIGLLYCGLMIRCTWEPFPLAMISGLGLLSLVFGHAAQRLERQARELAETAKD